MKKELVITNEVSEIAKIVPFIEELAEQFSLPTELIFNLNLVLEEALTNVILYAYSEKGQDIYLSVEKKDNILIFTLTDKGEEFDPTKTEDPDVTLEAEERPIGGLGIFLIKNIMDEVEYQRIEGQNVFTLKKKVE